MIYLVGLLIEWLGKAVFPTVVMLVVGALLVALTWALFLRSRRGVVVRSWVALGIVTVGFGVWRTAEVWHDFNQPQYRNFRDFVAAPIPGTVRNLAMDTAAPAMFHRAALVRFEAPEALFRQLVDHSIPGARSWPLADQVTQAAGSGATNRLIVAAADGRSYLKVDTGNLIGGPPETFRWARGRLEQLAQQGRREAYVLLVQGAGGSFQSVMLFEPATSKVVIHQCLERPPRPNPASAR